MINHPMLRIFQNSFKIYCQTIEYQKTQSNKNVKKRKQNKKQMMMMMIHHQFVCAFDFHSIYARFSFEHILLILH